MRPGTYVAEAAVYGRARRAFWEQAERRPVRSWGAYYHRRLSDCYRHLVPEGIRVLEVGCAHGDLLASVKQMRRGQAARGRHRSGVHRETDREHENGAERHELTVAGGGLLRSRTRISSGLDGTSSR